MAHGASSFRSLQGQTGTAGQVQKSHPGTDTGQLEYHIKGVGVHLLLEQSPVPRPRPPRLAHVFPAHSTNLSPSRGRTVSRRSEQGPRRQAPLSEVKPNSNPNRSSCSPPCTISNVHQHPRTGSACPVVRRGVP